jgi:hypothetical protein
MSLTSCSVALAACILPSCHLIGCRNGRPALVSSKNFDHEHCSVEILPATGLEPGPCDQGVKLRLNTKFDSRLEFGGLFSRLTDFTVVRYKKASL